MAACFAGGGTTTTLHLVMVAGETMMPFSLSLIFIEVAVYI